MQQFKLVYGAEELAEARRVESEYPQFDISAEE
jgi:hypothetical protein